MLDPATFSACKASASTMCDYVVLKECLHTGYLLSVRAFLGYFRYIYIYIYIHINK